MLGIVFALAFVFRLLFYNKSVDDGCTLFWGHGQYLCDAEPILTEFLLRLFFFFFSKKQKNITPNFIKNSL